MEMEKIIENIQKIINIAKEQKEELNKIWKNVEDLDNIARKKEQEAEEIEDKKSGFYEDAINEADKANTKHREASRDYERVEKVKTTVLEKAKESILKQLEIEQEFIDNNRKVDLSKYTPEKITELKEERDSLKEEIELNSISKEEFEKMSDEDKNKVRKAKENYLNNTKRLKEIEPTVDLLDALGGKKPKDRFDEISGMIKEIEEKFNFENIGEIDLSKIINKEQEETKEFKEHEEQKESEEKTEKTETKKDEPKENVKTEDTQKETTEPKRDNRSIAIEFDAKKGVFKVDTLNGFEKDISKNLKASKITLDMRQRMTNYMMKKYSLKAEQMKNIDIYAATILHSFDVQRNSDKLDKYIETMMSDKRENLSNKVKLQENKIIMIDYDLRGLYDNDNLDKETQRSIMDAANANKRNEVGDVVKGVRTYLLEKMDNAKQRRERVKQARLASGEQVKENVNKQTTNNENKEEKTTTYEKAEAWKQYTKPQRQSELSKQVQVPEETKQKLDEVSKKHFEGKEVEESIKSTAEKLVADVNRIMNEDNDEKGQNR